MSKHVGAEVINDHIKGGSTTAIFRRTMIAGIVGGTVSEVTGGKFANGVKQSAIQWLFNNESSNIYSFFKELNLLAKMLGYEDASDGKENLGKDIPKSSIEAAKKGVNVGRKITISALEATETTVNTVTNVTAVAALRGGPIAPELATISGVVIIIGGVSRLALIHFQQILSRVAPHMALLHLL